MAEEYIGRYQIIETIASGSQGAVHRAFDPQLNRIVALKVLLLALISQSQQLERFRREATLMSAIDHPNVVKILDVGSDGDSHYLAMELLPESLSRIIETSRQLPIENAVRFAIQVADGLAAVHDAGIIHRDIKPQNILIDAEGVAKVTDFGIARGDMLGTLTATGVMMGTPYYMSPEQAAGGDVDARSDIYALGGVLYQMLAGEVVFNATTPLAILRLHIDEPPRPVESLRAETPATISEIVMRALSKGPEERFQSASAMAEALRTAMPGVADSAPVVQTPVDAPTPSSASTPTPVRPSRGQTSLPAESWEVSPRSVVSSGEVRRSRRRSVPVKLVAIITAIIAAPVLAFLGLSTCESPYDGYFDRVRSAATTATATPVPALLRPSVNLQRLDSLPTGTIVTVAGGKPASSGVAVGDGGVATAALLSNPSSVAFDAARNLYIADTGNSRVRRVNATTGVIITVAGTSQKDYDGDGGLGNAASLVNPEGVAVDSEGNLYIADTGDNRVRRVDAVTGIITTIAGTGEDGESGDGGPATEASLDRPTSVAVDVEGNLYIADTGNNRVRRVDAATGIITTVTGTGERGYGGDGGRATKAALSWPTGVAVDANGNLYIADSENRRVRRVDTTTGIINTIAGTGEYGYSGNGGPAAEAEFGYPEGVAIDVEGNLYVAETGNNRVRRVDATTGIITTVTGVERPGYDGDDGPTVAASPNDPSGVTVDIEGNLYIADTGNNRVRRVDVATGIIATVAGTSEWGYGGDGGPATEAMLDYPRGLTVDGEGNLYIAEKGNHRVRRVDAVTGIITTIAGTGVWSYGGDGGPATEAPLREPNGVAADGEGNLYIADDDNRRIRRLDAATGIITTIAGTGEWGHDGDGGPATEATFSFLGSVTLDTKGNLYIADSWNRVVRVVVGVTSPG